MNIMMNEKIKNYLGGALILAVLLVGFAAYSYADTYSKQVQPSSYRAFSVTGEGKVVGIPDVAAFTFSVISQGGKDLAKLQTENNTKANKAIAYLKDGGVSKDDIKTDGYNVEPRYQYFSCPTQMSAACPPAEIVGYSVTQTVSVKARDFGKIGSLVSGVVSNGANSVSQLNFTIDEPSTLENAARTKAIDQAKAKAQAIAKAGGFSLGKLLDIQEGGYYPQPMYYAKSAMMETSMGGAPVAPDIQAGSQDVKINVTLRYEIN